MVSKVETGAEGHARFQPRHAEPRNLQSMSADLQRRLDDASRALEALKTQQATCNSLLRQFQGDFDAALALSREMKELVDHQAEEPSGVVATLQAAVEKTRDTVVGQVENVRERAAAAFHRIKGDEPRAEAGGQEKADPSSTKDGDGRAAG
jgi:chromosome segregation ATPase